MLKSHFMEFNYNKKHFIYNIDLNELEKFKNLKDGESIYFTDEFGFRKSFKRGNMKDVVITRRDD